MPCISEDTQFAELMNQVRHLGTLRFAMLGVFIAMAGGFFAMRFGVENPAKEIVKYGPCFVSALAVIFGFFEVYASCRYVAFAERACRLEGKEGPIFQGKKVKVLGLVTVGTVLIYVVIAAFWWAM